MRAGTAQDVGQVVSVKRSTVIRWNTHFVVVGAEDDFIRPAVKGVVTAGNVVEDHV